jgi:hypothetical protein
LLYEIARLCGRTFAVVELPYLPLPIAAKDGMPRQRQSVYTVERNAKEQMERVVSRGRLLFGEKTKKSLPPLRKLDSRLGA